jgi:hypothetical protein
MRIVGIALAAVLGLAAVARAEPLELKQVAADAKWLVHVDVDAMRDVDRGAEGLPASAWRCTRTPPKHLDKVKEMLGHGPPEGPARGSPPTARTSTGSTAC